MLDMWYVILATITKGKCETILIQILIHSLVRLLASFSEEAISVPKVRLGIWQLDQEHTWIWAQLPVHRVKSTPLSPTSMCTNFTVFPYTLIALFIKSYDAIYKSWLVYPGHYKPSWIKVCSTCKSSASAASLNLAISSITYSTLTF